MKAIIYNTVGIGWDWRVNTSLFIRLIREGTIILIKYTSKIFPLKVFLRAIDNTDHRKT